MERINRDQRPLFIYTKEFQRPTNNKSYYGN